MIISGGFVRQQSNAWQYGVGRSSVWCRNPMQHPCTWLVQHMRCHLQHPATARCPCICHCSSQSCIAEQSITAAAGYKHVCTILPKRLLKLAISKRSTQSVVKARRPQLQATCIALEKPALLHSHSLVDNVFTGAKHGNTACRQMMLVQPRS